MLSSLEKIRQQYAAKNDSAKCPLCSHPLTIEKTKFFTSEVCENCLAHVKIIDLDTCCDSPDLHHVKQIISGGGIQVKKQCKNCGQVTSNPIGGFSKEDREKLPLLNAYLRDDRYEQTSTYTRQFYQTISEKRLEKKRAKYNDYLKTPEWKKKSTEVLKRDNHLCQSCLDAFATQVHHKSYQLEDLSGNVPAFDLVAICTPCHDKIHKTMNNDGKDKND